MRFNLSHRRVRLNPIENSAYEDLFLFLFSYRNNIGTQSSVQHTLIIDKLFTKARSLRSNLMN